MIGQTISHYPALWDSASRRDSGKRNKILEKLGEARPNDLLTDVGGTNYGW